MLQVRTQGSEGRYLVLALAWALVIVVYCIAYALCTFALCVAVYIMASAVYILADLKLREKLRDLQ